MRTDQQKILAAMKPAAELHRVMSLARRTSIHSDNVRTLLADMKTAGLVQRVGPSWAVTASGRVAQGPQTGPKPRTPKTPTETVEFPLSTSDLSVAFRELRKELGVVRKDVAYALGHSAPTTVSRVENGGTTSPETYAQMFAALGFDVTITLTPRSTT